MAETTRPTPPAQTGIQEALTKRRVESTSPRDCVASSVLPTNLRKAHASFPIPSQADPVSENSLPLVAHIVSRPHMQIVPATAKRKWMDDTGDSFANRCLPLLIANQWGWFILNDRRIEIQWNAGSRPQDIHIRYAKKSDDERLAPDDLLAVSHFGHGILTWRLPYLFQTPPGWNLYVRGPANWCKDAICPLDGVVETDWSPATFTMNWKFTRPNTLIVFEEGEPICMVFTIPRGSVERFSPEILTLSQNPALERNYREWAHDRKKNLLEVAKNGTKYRWQKHYLRGISLHGDVFPGHQTKLALREFRDLREQPPPITPESPDGWGPTPMDSESTAHRSELPPRDRSDHAEGSVVPYTEKLDSSYVAQEGGISFPHGLAPESPNVDFKIVVSSENSSYMAWQTQLFCFSALTRLGKQSTVVVHRATGPLCKEFEVVKKWGCSVIEAPQFRVHPRGEYPARNEPGSLLTIATHPEFREGYVLFCEPDMLFAKCPLYLGKLCGEYYHYLDYSQERFRVVARKFGIEDAVETLNRTSKIGVPYLIPGQLVARIAQRWLEVLDLFEEFEWIDIMYAFGIALTMENLSAEITRLMADNRDPLSKLKQSIVHYCYGDARWNKRSYYTSGSPLDPATRVPSTKGLSGTVLGEILRQIRQASACTQYPRIFNSFRSMSSSLSR